MQPRTHTAPWTWRLTALLLCALASGCPGGDRQAAPPVAHAEPAAHAEHDHDEEAPSDLDRPVEELLAATCEHGVKTYTCGECRYEVGVVAASSHLFDGGLLKTAKVEARKISTSLDLTGEVQLDERRVTHVSTLAEGVIREVHATLGDQVVAGQPLVTIDSVVVGEAEADFLEAKGLLGLARRDHARLSALRQEGIASEKELLAAQQALDAAQIRADAALGKLTRLGVAPAAAQALSAETSRGRLVLRAPSAGRILDMHAVTGEIARSAASLLTVGDSSALWVWADLYERDVARVARAQAAGSLAASIEVKAFPGETFRGQVDFVSPAMSEASRTVKLRVAVPNPDGRLLAGLFATVRLFLPEQREALSVPRCAVLEDAGRRFVFVHQQGEYYLRRPVTSGAAVDGWVEITQGLRGGETVVSDGAFLLKSDVLRSKMGAGCAD